jgi:hypothetical protein
VGVYVSCASSGQGAAGRGYGAGGRGMNEPRDEIGTPCTVRRKMT